jgi:hypothetical protein
MTDTHEKQQKSVSIRFPLDILQAMKQLAEQHNRSLNGEVLTALREYIATASRKKKAHEPLPGKEYQ